jgi:hypothetical protein
MRRFPWWIPVTLLALLTGLGLGLVYSWVISPARATDTEPAILRADFKEQYRSAIAAAYAATGNLPRAQARLAYLGDVDPVPALNAQAQRMLASGESFQQAEQVAGLALALSNNGTPIPTETAAIGPVTEIASNETTTPTSTLPPPPPDVPIVLTGTAETVEPEPTQAVVIQVTPRPTRTPVPAFGAPFKSTGQDTVCDPNLPDGLLQIIVYNSRRKQMAGIEIVVTWDGGGERFFTGFKPEISDGYADFIMTPNIAYSVQLARGSDIVSGLTAPACQASNGESYFGGIKLTFQQP